MDTSCIAGGALGCPTPGPKKIERAPKNFGVIPRNPLTEELRWTQFSPLPFVCNSRPLHGEKTAISAHDLYMLAISKNGSAFDKLPYGVQNRLEKKLSGIAVPNGVGLEEFSTAFSRISAKVFRPPGPQFNVYKQLKAMADPKLARDPLFGVNGKFSVGYLEEKFGELKPIFDIVNASSTPGAFLRYLMNYPQVSYRVLYDTLSIFHDDRKIEFIDVPEDKQNAGAHLLEMSRCELTMENMKKMLSIIVQTAELPDLYDAYQALAVLTSPEATMTLILESNPEFFDNIPSILDLERLNGTGLDKLGLHSYGGEIFQFERYFVIGEYKNMRGYVTRDPRLLREMGRRGIAIQYQNNLENKMIVESDSEELIQHELQHLLDFIVLPRTSNVDVEYRAFLAQLAFSRSDAAAEDLFKIKFRHSAVIRTLNFYRAKRHPVHAKSPHVKAKNRILYELHTHEGRIKSAAKALLNAAYEKACGLKYDELMEPFKS